LSEFLISKALAGGNDRDITNVKAVKASIGKRMKLGSKVTALVLYKPEVRSDFSINAQQFSSPRL
jgi:hypothetical protein